MIKHFWETSTTIFPSQANTFCEHNVVRSCCHGNTAFLNSFLFFFTKIVNKVPILIKKYLISKTFMVSMLLLVNKPRTEVGLGTFCTGTIWLSFWVNLNCISYSTKGHGIMQCILPDQCKFLLHGLPWMSFFTVFQHFYQGT